MDKRTVLAIALSMLILLVWSSAVTRLTPPQSLPPKPAQTAQKALLVGETKPATVPQALPGTFLTFDQAGYEVIFQESQASIKEVVFKNYQSYHFSLRDGFLLPEPRLVFTKDSATANSIVFTAADSDKRVIKRFIFHNSNYTIELEIEIQNTSSQVLTVNLPLVLGVLNFSGDRNKARFQDITVAQEEKILRPSVHKNLTADNIKFLGIRDQYFCSIIEPLADKYSAFIKKPNPQETEVGLVPSGMVLNPGQKITQQFRIYLGPQELRIISSIKPAWAAIMYYGTFDLISQILVQVVGFLYQLVHNWGLAIIFLTILIFFILFPLTLKQMRSVKKMQAVQPHVNELKLKYKDNPQRLNKEMMELYRQHKVNPLGGCLPTLLQLPIFFGLYQALIRSVALKGAKFLWIKDLSEPDRAFVLPISIPFLGNAINILPILMVIAMFIQQKITSVSYDSASSEQQKLMLVVMPAMFLVIFYNMPAGLVLYWFINSTLMLVYQFKISRAK